MKQPKPAVCKAWCLLTHTLLIKARVRTLSQDWQVPMQNRTPAAGAGAPVPPIAYDPVMVDPRQLMDPQQAAAAVAELRYHRNKRLEQAAGAGARAALSMD